MNCRKNWLLGLLLFLFFAGCQVDEPYTNPIQFHAFRASSDPIEQNTTVVLSVSATSSVKGDLTYAYQLLSGGGSLSASSNCNVAYSVPAVGGPFEVQVTVTDSAGNKNKLVQTFWRGKRWETLMTPTTANIGDGDRFQSVCVARDNTLYVTFQRWGTVTMPMDAKCYRYDSGSWIQIGDGEYRNFHIDSVAGDHYPYVTFVSRVYNQTASDLHIWQYREGMSNAQACFTNDFSGLGYAVENRPRLALTSDNTLYLACLFYDISAPISSERKRYLSVFRYQADVTNWVCVGSNLSSEAPSEVSLVVTKGGTPIVAYQDSKGRTYVKQYTVNGWVRLGSGAVSSGAARQPCLAVSPATGLYIAYHDSLNGERVTVKRYNGREWTTVGVAGFSEGAAQWITLLFDSHDTPYVVFQNGALAGRLSCMRFDGSQWVYVGNPAGSAFGAAYVDAAIGPDDTIYAAYRSMSGSFGTAVVRLK